MSIRSALTRLKRLVESTPVLTRLGEHAEFLETFVTAHPWHKQLVDELAKRTGTRALAELLPRTAPDRPEKVPTAFGEVDTEALRGLLAIALGGWWLDRGARLPAGTLQTAVFDRPACVTVTPAGDLVLCREVRFVLVDKAIDPATGRHFVIELPDGAADSPEGLELDARDAKTGELVRVRRVARSDAWPVPHWQVSEPPADGQGSAVPE